MSTLSPLLSYNNFINTIIALLTVFWFNNLLVYDKKIKKITFGITLLIIYRAADINHLSARTTLLFLKAAIWQVWIIGIIVWSRNAVSQFLLLKIKCKQQILIKNIIWQYVFATVLAIQVFSTIFLLLLIIIFPDYYQSPLDFPEFKYIIIPFLFIFVGVAIFDKLFFKNYKNSTRRKTFHFVPVIVAPILIAINYKLAILLSVTAYFLFWQMETVRYFGKLARRQIQNQQKDAQENQQRKQQEINLNNISPVLSLFYKLNKRLQKFRLFLWMEQLNSSRQPHFYFTHLSLMLGLTLTFIFYSCSSNSSSHTCSPLISQNIPILIRQNMSIFLTIADAIAAIIGSKYGKHQISAKNKKTYQGYLGFVVTLVIIQLLLGLVGVWFVGNTVNIQYGLIIISAVFCGLGELFSGDMDNIATGLVYIIVVSLYDKICG